MIYEAITKMTQHIPARPNTSQPLGSITVGHGKPIRTVGTVVSFCLCSASTLNPMHTQAFPLPMPLTGLSGDISKITQHLPTTSQPLGRVGTCRIGIQIRQNQMKIKNPFPRSFSKSSEKSMYVLKSLLLYRTELYKSLS